MIGIKKVQVVPLDENYGKIIDSLNPATDDKTKNAPSIHAVNNALSDIYTKTEVDTAIETNTTSIMSDVADDYLLKTDASSTYKLKGDFAVLTGSLSSGSATINYPTGFTKDNCVVISTMLQHPTNPNYFWGNGSTFDSTGAINGCLPVRVRLGSDDINITSKIIGLTNNETSAVTDITTAYNYKIILMKIS